MDARFNRALADNLRAQADACKAAGEYSDARFDLAVTLSRWNTLPDVIAHFERKGFMERDNELAVLAAELETKLINARIARDQAMLVLQSFQPQPPPAPLPPITPPPAQTPPPLPPGLTPAEIDEMLAQMPELSPETRRSISYILNARLREKG